MRRSDGARDRSFAFDVIDRCGHGVAALSTGGEGPYCIPLSLVRVGDDLFFHCALEGRKPPGEQHVHHLLPERRGHRHRL